MEPLLRSRITFYIALWKLRSSQGSNFWHQKVLTPIGLKNEIHWIPKKRKDCLEVHRFWSKVLQSRESLGIPKMANSCIAETCGHIQDISRRQDSQVVFFLGVVSVLRRNVDSSWYSLLSRNAEATWTSQIRCGSCSKSLVRKGGSSALAFLSDLSHFLSGAGLEFPADVLWIKAAWLIWCSYLQGWHGLAPPESVAFKVWTALAFALASLAGLYNPNIPVEVKARHENGTWWCDEFSRSWSLCSTCCSCKRFIFRVTRRPVACGNHWDVLQLL